MNILVNKTDKNVSKENTTYQQFIVYIQNKFIFKNHNIQHTKKRQNVCISQTILDLTHADVFYVTSRNITSSIMGAIRDYTTKFQEIRLITFYLKMFYKQKCRAWKKEIWVSYWMLIDRQTNAEL